MDLDNWDGQVELGQFFVSYLSIFKSGAKRCFVQLTLKKASFFSGRYQASENPISEQKISNKKTRQTFVVLKII